MGISISMRPGSVMRSKGEPVDVTPGWRSAAVSVLQDTFGKFPMEIDADDESTLVLMARAARVYTRTSIWDQLLAAVREHGIITLDKED